MGPGSHIYISKRFKVSVHQKVALFGAIISFKFQKKWMGFRFFNVSCLLWGQTQYFPFSVSYKETWDERLASKSPLPCLPRAIVLNLGKKIYRRRNCSCSGEKNSICCLASESKRQLGEIIPLGPLTLFCELVTFLSNYLCYLIQSYHHYILIISVAPVCTDLWFSRL